MKRRRHVRLIPLVVLLINQIVAVEVANPSKTSIGSAARRALAARDYDPSVRNPDWLAEIFVGPNERMIMAGDRTIKNLEGDYREAIKDDDPITGMNLIRTRFADERLESAVRAGATQVVILGAGYDSRAYRLRELLKDVRVF
jgi:methyltransferase (TIGR00027 family)